MVLETLSDDVAVEIIRESEKNQRYLNEHREEVRRDYAGKYVIVVKQKIVDSGKDEQELLDKLQILDNQKGVYATYRYIQDIGEHFII